MWALHCCFEHADQLRYLPFGSYGRPDSSQETGCYREMAAVEIAAEEEEIIKRVVALDVGKAEVVCCVRVPGPGRRRASDGPRRCAGTRQ